MRRNWTKIQMDSKTGCLSARLPLWTLRALLHHPQRFLPSHISRKYSRYITTLLDGPIGFAHLFILFGPPELHLHYSECKQNQRSSGTNPLVDIWKSGGFLNENSVRGHIPKLQAGTVQNGDVIWKINRYKPFSPGTRKMCRCGPFRLNSLGVIDICHNTWDICLQGIDVIKEIIEFAGTDWDAT